MSWEKYTSAVFFGQYLLILFLFRLVFIFYFVGFCFLEPELVLEMQVKHGYEMDGG